LFLRIYIGCSVIYSDVLIRWTWCLVRAIYKSLVLLLSHKTWGSPVYILFYR
jgi:hypothetical protein